MYNYEVVRRLTPCAYYMDPDRMTECRWCDMRTHLRVEETSFTCCGHNCVDGDWAPIEDWHPEDVAAMDRCYVCYAAFQRDREENRKTYF